ncbi:MAG: hypothetical protein PWQ17_693, partial [Anaerophaga sp.]|nr:hypothetical protein [Anaerophaga sp.]
MLIVNISQFKRMSQLMNNFNYLKGAVACPLSGPADGGKPKWATFMALRNGRKFWLSRGAR